MVGLWYIIDKTLLALPCFNRSSLPVYVNIAAQIAYALILPAEILPASITEILRHNLFSR